MFAPYTDVSFTKSPPKQAAPPNGHTATPVVMAVLLRDATSTEGKGTASDFPKSITSAFCAGSQHGGVHWSSCLETAASSAREKYDV